ncbi:hypothetical protein EI427_11930 [Flammeovirga pectinis]|uniref:ResB-like domain-containing protein n=1 Tax=Flammeovirga pectinis TaxID=2494373 RepID=A0A3Q9FRA8_9BACT|nr:cytochrome c biogenesis protein ResB [Flammeovirga pectinis]AZQ62920.1 hypothetical protein EI427_11930 [Flammeovirga pectinis]
MTRPTHEQRTPLWQFPWGYAESFIFGIGLFLTGCILQYTIGSVKAVHYPLNMYFMLTFWFGLGFVHYFAKKTSVVKWLRSVPLAVASSVLVLVLVVVMGTIPQASYDPTIELDPLGFSNMTESWPFAFVMFLMLTNLGLATWNRILPFKLKNLGFIFNHLGLWVTVVAAGLGSGDLQRLSMDLYEGKTEWKAYDKDLNDVELPLAIKLNKFSITEFPPKIAFANRETGKVMSKGENAFVMIDPDLKAYLYKDWKVEIVKYLYESAPVNGVYQQFNDDGAAPAALIKLTNQNTGKTVEGWICAGSFRFDGATLQVDDEYEIGILPPEAKKFSSNVTLYTKDGEQKTTDLEVNYPIEVGGWKVYQLSYDERFGRWSKLSVVELVRDPWLPVVYIGIFMMMIGAAYIIWTGQKQS